MEQSNLIVEPSIALLLLFGGFIAVLALLGSRRRLLLLLLLGASLMAVLLIASIAAVGFSFRSSNSVGVNIQRPPPPIQLEAASSASRRVLDTNSAIALSAGVKSQIDHALENPITSSDGQFASDSSDSIESIGNEPNVSSRSQAAFEIVSIDDASMPPSFSEPAVDGTAAEVVALSQWGVTISDCEDSLPNSIRRAIITFNDQFLAGVGGSTETLVRLPDTSLVDATARIFNSHEFPESGLMYRLAVRLEMGESYQQDLSDCWKDTVVSRRLTYVGLPSIDVFLVLGTVLTYLRLDTDTRGTRTGQLRAAAFAMILMIVGSGVAAIRFLPWL